MKSTVDRSIKELRGVWTLINDAGIEITGIYMPTEETDAGLELMGKYVLQIAHYHVPPVILDDLMQNEIACFEDVNQLIEFLAKTRK